MLEFKVSVCGNFCEITQVIFGMKTDRQSHNKPLVDFKFQDDWYTKHHQHKVDAIIAYCEANNTSRDDVIYSSGDSSVRGNGVHDKSIVIEPRFDGLSSVDERLERDRKVHKEHIRLEKISPKISDEEYDSKMDAFVASL